MNEKELDGKKIYCGRAEKKTERLQKLKEEYKKKLDEYQKTQGLNLYFKNIDESSYDEETLKKILTEFGEITSFSIMRNNDEKKTSKGFGFVSYKKAEDAQNAIQKLHGKMINEKSKPLYITVFQPKDIRRQHLEIQYSQRNFTSNPYQNVFLQNQTQNQFYNNIMRPRWTNQNQNQNNQRKRIQNNKNMNMNNSNNMNKDNRENRDNKDYRDNRDNRDNRDKSNKGYKFNQNVKNPIKNSESVNTQKMELTQNEESSNVLSTSYLANLQPKEVRQILGERLYPMVSQITNNQMVGKITGMLLDMDTSEILLLLESPESLEIKVKKALKSLENVKKTVE
jgi:polyadenylate-binding protein